MTDDADQPSDPRPARPADLLLALQHVDTDADQLRARRERLAEREELATQSALLAEWERRRTAITDRLQALTELIEAAERTGAALGADRARLDAQLKTVIAPREAEALMHEIDAINVRRDELDDEELAALEEQSALDDDLTALLREEEALREGERLADEALAAAVADIDTELDDLARRRVAAFEALDEQARRRYDKVRSSSGVAVAELKGHRCEGCHLDLSAAEVDTVKEEAAATGFTDCPQCGRMLVV